MILYQLNLPAGYQPSIHQFGSFCSLLLYSYPPNAPVVGSLKNKNNSIRYQILLMRIIRNKILYYQYHVYWVMKIQLLE